MPAYYDGDIPWAIIGDLNDSIVHTTARNISEAGLRNSSAKLIPKGSVLVAMYGSIGKLGIAGIRLTTNQAIAFTHPKHVNPRYLFWYLRGIRADLLALGKGGTQTNISQTVIKAVPFPVAPRPEQDEIVAAIETQFARLDDAVAALERARTRLKRYRASVLKAACEGRLVPTEAELAREDGRAYEPASVLLERIAAERAAAPGKKRGKAISEPPVDTAELPELPEGWAWTVLRSIADIKGGITKGQKPKNGEVLREVPYLRVANVQRGYLDLTEVKLILVPEQQVQELRLQSGDVLFNEGGDRDKLGRGWVWQEQIDECVHQNHVFRARLLHGFIEPKYVSWYGNSFGQQYFIDQGKQTTNLASINLTKLGNLPIPLPPLAEQTRIVAEVERRMSIIEQMEATVETSLKRAAALRQSILRVSFHRG